MTEFWSKKLKKDLKSFYNLIYWGPFLFLFLNAIFCFSLKRNINLNFWILFVPVTIGSTIFCILSPRRAIRRYRNVVEAFEFKSEDEISLTLIDGRILSISKPELIDDVFSVDHSGKICKAVINKSDENDYTIIPEFFTPPVQVSTFERY